MEFEKLLLTNEGSVQVITIDRPDQLNALNKQTIRELSTALTEADSDNDIRCVIITGSGEKAFVAGADIKEFADFSVEQGKSLSAEGHNLLFDHVEKLNTPVIAAINGYALGGGLELAMSCHIRVASENARLGLPETSLGLIPGYGGTQRLTRLVGKGKALELICTAGMLQANEALQWGLVNHVVNSSDLMNTAMDLAQRISNNSPSAIAAAIRAVNAGFKPMNVGMAAEIEEFGKCFGTADFREGTDAFLNKRKPEFKGL